MLFLGDKARCHGEDIFCHSLLGRWRLCCERLTVFLLSRLAIVIISLQIPIQMLCIKIGLSLPSRWAPHTGSDSSF